MIAPFADKLVSEEDGKKYEYGLGSYGHDIRLSPEQCLVFGRIDIGEFDPADFNPEILRPELLEDEKANIFYCLLSVTA